MRGFSCLRRWCRLPQSLKDAVQAVAKVDPICVLAWGCTNVAERNVPGLDEIMFQAIKGMVVWYLELQLQLLGAWCRKKLTSPHQCQWGWYGYTLITAGCKKTRFSFTHNPMVQDSWFLLLICFGQLIPQNICDLHSALARRYLTCVSQKI